jgi:hypothetical protein
MKPTNDIRELFRKAAVDTRPGTDDTVLAKVLAAHEAANANDSTASRSSVRSTIMKSPITRLAIAAVVVLAALAGGALVFKSTMSTTGTNRLPAGDMPFETGTAESFRAEVFTIRKMAAAGDVKGLATMLAQGQFESKLVAANLLAKMGNLPALEAATMHAAGDLRADRPAGKLRLYSTGHADWLELADGTIIVHAESVQQQATEVRLTHNREDNEQQWNSRQTEAADMRNQRADLEEKLARATGIPSDVNQLRERIESWTEILDLLDGAIYVSPVNGGLHVQDRVYHRETYLFPSESSVRAEWHGDAVEADSVTLLHGLAPVATDGPVAPPDDWRSRFDAVYSLADDEILRWVRPPFVPERRNYTQTLHHYHGTDNPSPPLFLSFRWDGTLRNWGLSMHECVLGSVLRCLGLKQRYEWDAPRELFLLRLGGDWIVRADTPVEERLSALERILEAELGRRIRFVRQRVEREVIVVRGRYERQYLEGQEDTDLIYLFAGASPDETMILGRGAHESIAELLDRVGNRFNRPVILETQGLDGVSTWYQPCVSYATWVRRKGESNEPFPIDGEEKLDPVLANLTRQTSLEFSRETRPFDMWVVSEIED